MSQMEHMPPPPESDMEVSKERKKNTFGKALLAALVLALVTLALAFAVNGAPTAHEIGKFLGRLIAVTLVSALITWAITRKRSISWPFWQLILLNLPFFLVLHLITSSGTR